MSKKTTGTDIGYRAYFAAFAVMLIIVIAAICILSGCLDSLIFTAGAPSTDTQSILEPDTQPHGTEPIDSGDVSPLPIETNDEPVSSDSVPESESNTENDQTEPPQEPEDTEKTPDTTEPADTTKSPDTVSTPETTETPETSAEPEDTDEPDDDIDSDEIISQQDNNLLLDFNNSEITVIGYDGAPSKISVSRYIDGVDVIAIGSRAFSDIAELNEVRLSSGIRQINSEAMSGCDNLTVVYIPTTVTQIAKDAFSASPNVVIHCKKGSYAEHYAIQNNIDLVAN